MISEEKTLFNSKGKRYVTVYYDHTIPATVDVWSGEFETKENFYQGLTLVLDNIKAHGSEKWLADLSHIEGNFEFARDYISQKVVPEAQRYGLIFEALVVPNSVVPMVAVQETLEKINNFEICIFGSIDEARRWLTNKKVSDHHRNRKKR